MKTMPTYWADDDLLIGKKAKEAWAAQIARCACGSCGDEEHSLHGTAGEANMPAQWLGCDNCSGSALGRPLVYRTQSQIIHARRTVRA